MSENSKTENVNKRIALKTFVEIDFAADGRNTDAVPVMGNTGDDTGEESPIGGDTGCWRKATDTKTGIERS